MGTRAHRPEEEMVGRSGDEGIIVQLPSTAPATLQGRAVYQPGITSCLNIVRRLSTFSLPGGMESLNVSSTVNSTGYRLDQDAGRVMIGGEGMVSPSTTFCTVTDSRVGKASV